MIQSTPLNRATFSRTGIALTHRSSTVFRLCLKYVDMSTVFEIYTSKPLGVNLWHIFKKLPNSVKIYTYMKVMGVLLWGTCQLVPALQAPHWGPGAFPLNWPLYTGNRYILTSDCLNPQNV